MPSLVSLSIVGSTSAIWQMLAQGTYYGQQGGQDDAAACAYGNNFANSLSAEWSTGVQTFIAINREQYNNSQACGLCIMYRSALLYVMQH